MQQPIITSSTNRPTHRRGFFALVAIVSLVWLSVLTLDTIQPSVPTDSPPTTTTKTTVTIDRVPGGICLMGDVMLCQAVQITTTFLYQKEGGKMVVQYSTMSSRTKWGYVDRFGVFYTGTPNPRLILPHPTNPLPQ